MPQFQPDQVTFRDIPGMSYWDMAHHREHLQFVQVLATKSPAVVLGDYDLLQMLTSGGNRRATLETHQEAHELLRSATGVDGLDYTAFDLANEGDFYGFLGYHAAEHAAIRQALGIV
jgi:hypothetical protein